MERDNANEEEEHSPSTWEELSDADKNLHNAIVNHDTLAVHQAIQDGANVRFCVTDQNFNLPSPYAPDCTPLILAVCEHDGSDASHQVVRILLDAGADPWWQDSRSESAISYACEDGHLSIVETLLDHDNDILEITEDFLWTPLISACAHQQTDIVRFLLNRGANVHATGGNGMTAKLYGCCSNLALT